MDAFSVGSVFSTLHGQFVIVSEVAHSADRITYIGESRGSELMAEGTPVSITVYAVDGADASETVDRLIKRRLASEKCRNLARVIEVKEIAGSVVCISEWVVGDTLETVVATGGPLSQQAMTEMIRPIAGAVGALHSVGLTDNVISPANIVMATAADGRCRPVLIDLGDSAQVGYMSEEKCARSLRLTEASDIYSLGATIFFALTGERPPLAAEVNPATLSSMLGPDVAEFVKQVVVRAMSLHPADRQHSADMLIKQISGELSPMAEPAIRMVTSAPRVISTPKPTRRGSGNNTLLYVLIGVLVALLIALGVIAYIYLGGNSHSEPVYDGDYESVGYTTGTETGAKKVSGEAKDAIGSESKSGVSERSRSTETASGRSNAASSSGRGSYDMAFHQLVPGSNVRTLTMSGQTFYFNRAGEWTNQDYEDTLHDRYWDFDGLRRSSESYTTSDGSRGTMYYRWEGTRLVELNDPMRGFSVERDYDGAGHCIKSVTNYYDGRPSSVYTYYNYKTDSRGNWISRQNSRGGTEKRQITYWD